MTFWPEKITYLNPGLKCPFCGKKRLNTITAYDIEEKRNVPQHYYCRDCGRNVQLDEINTKSNKIGEKMTIYCPCCIKQVTKRIDDETFECRSCKTIFTVKKIGLVKIIELVK